MPLLEGAENILSAYDFVQVAWEFTRIDCKYCSVKIGTPDP